MVSVFSQFDNNITDSPYSYDYQEQYGYTDDMPGHSEHMMGSDYIDDGYNRHMPIPDNADNWHGYEDLGMVSDYDVGMTDHCNIHCLLCKLDPLAHAHCYRCHPLMFGDDGRPLVHVDGYYRSDGTYVQEHYRTAPDGDPTNNFSSR